MNVVIVGNTGIKDAVIAGPFTGGNAVLFVDKTSIPTSVLDELRRLAPVEILIFGGEARVSASVEAALNAVAPVTRIAGASVFGTAIAASQKLFPPVVDPPVDPPTGMFIPKLQGPILTHDGNPEVINVGVTTLDDGQTHEYRNVKVVGQVNVKNGTTLILSDFEIDTDHQAVGINAYSGGKAILKRGVVWNGNDGLKNNIDAEQVTIHRLYRSAGAHMDCYQAEATAEASFRWCYMDAKHGSDLGNAAFQIKPESASHIQKVTVEDCYINGGNYTVRVDATNRLPHAEFHRSLWGGDARYGVKAGPTAVWDVTGV